MPPKATPITTSHLNQQYSLPTHNRFAPLDPQSEPVYSDMHVDPYRKDFHQHYTGEPPGYHHQGTPQGYTHPNGFEREGQICTKGGEKGEGNILATTSILGTTTTMGITPTVHTTTNMGTSNTTYIQRRFRGRKRHRGSRGGRHKKKEIIIGQGIFNVSGIEFTEAEIKFLDSGLKFAPDQPYKEFKAYIDLQRFVRELNIKKY